MGNSFEWKADVRRRPSETEIDLEENAIILHFFNSFIFARLLFKVLRVKIPMADD